MPLILVFLSATIPVPVLHTALATLYRVNPDVIVMADADDTEAILVAGRPQIWCTYQFARGDFPTYLELGIAPFLTPGLDNTRSDYWFAHHACRMFDCSALIPLTSGDPYGGSGARAWVQPGQPLCRVFLNDEFISVPDPLFEIDRSIPIEPINAAIYEQGPRIYGLTITIERWLVKDGLHLVEGTFSDVDGQQWVFQEKASFVTTADLTDQSDYPQPGFIQCVILSHQVRDERTIVTITTREPWGLKTTTGVNQFDVFPAQLTPLYNDDLLGSEMA